MIDPNTLLHEKITREEHNRRAVVGFIPFSVNVIHLNSNMFLVVTVYQATLRPLQFYTEQSIYRHMGSGIIVRERRAPSLFDIDPNEVI